MAKKFLGELVAVKDALIQRNFNAIVEYLRDLEPLLPATKGIQTDIFYVDIPLHNTEVSIDIPGEIISFAGTYISYGTRNSFTDDSFPIGYGKRSLSQIVIGVGLLEGVDIAFTRTSGKRLFLRSQAVDFGYRGIARILVTYRK